MNPSVDVGCPPRPFRHLRMAERRTPDLSSSRAPVHSALVQKSVTAITNPAGRLSFRMLGNSRRIGKWKTINSWQAACIQSNGEFTKGLALLEGQADRWLIRFRRFTNERAAKPVPACPRESVSGDRTARVPPEVLVSAVYRSVLLS